MDGIRALWNGQCMYSRSGKVLHLPDHIWKEFPNVSLDGELWAGRGTLEKLVAILSSKNSQDWSGVKYCVFDLPDSPETYEVRMDKLSKLKFPPHIQVVARQQCEGNDHLQKLLSSICENGGEGLMAVRPGSHYTPFRSSNILKIKVTEVAIFNNLSCRDLMTLK